MLNRFYIGHKMIVYADARLNNDVVAKLFHRFTYETSSLELKAGAALSFVIGDISVPDVPEGCEYFHLGFDESHSHNANPALSARLSHYMSQLTREVQDEGKRPMIWMDMILPPDAFLGMQGNAHSVKSREDCIKIIRSLASNTVFVDWEYSVKHAPISSVLYYKDLGIDVMGAPWFGVENAHAHIDTVADHRLFGVMQTTWHTISSDLPNIIPIAKKLGAVLPTWEAESVPMIVSTLLRYVTHEQADYPSLGWVRHQLP